MTNGNNADDDVFVANNSKRIIKPNFHFDPNDDDDDDINSSANTTKDDLEFTTPVANRHHQSTTKTTSCVILRQPSPSPPPPVVRNSTSAVILRHPKPERKSVQFNYQQPSSGFVTRIKSESSPKVDYRRHSMGPPTRDSSPDSPVVTRRQKPLNSVSRRHSTLILTPPNQLTSKKPQFQTGYYQQAYTSSSGNNAGNNYTSPYRGNNDPSSLRTASYQMSNKYASIQYGPYTSHHTRQNYHQAAAKNRPHSYYYYNPVDGPYVISNNSPHQFSSIPYYPPGVPNYYQFNTYQSSSPVIPGVRRSNQHHHEDISPLTVSGLTRTARRLFSAPVVPSKTGKVASSPDKTGMRRQLPKVPDMTKNDTRFVSENGGNSALRCTFVGDGYLLLFTK